MRAEEHERETGDADHCVPDDNIVIIGAPRSDARHAAGDVVVLNAIVLVINENGRADGVGDGIISNTVVADDLAAGPIHINAAVGIILHQAVRYGAGRNIDAIIAVVAGLTVLDNAVSPVDSTVIGGNGQVFQNQILRTNAIITKIYAAATPTADGAIAHRDVGARAA